MFVLRMNFLLLTIITLTSTTLCCKLDKLHSIFTSNYKSIQSTKIKINNITLSNTNIDLIQTVFLQPKCINHSLISNTNVLYENCTLTLFAKPIVIIQGVNILNEDFLIIDLYTKYISYIEKSAYHYVIDIDVNQTTVNVNYNKLFLNVGHFAETPKDIQDIKYKIVDTYIQTINDFYTPTIFNKKDELNAVLSLLFMRKVCYNTEVDDGDEFKKVTYFYYLDHQVVGVVNMRDCVKIGKLIVIVEYSVDFDLNYKQGMVEFNDFVFVDKMILYSKVNFISEGDGLDEDGEEKENERIVSFIVNKVVKELQDSNDEYYTSKEFK